MEIFAIVFAGLVIITCVVCSVISLICIIIMMFRYFVVMTRYFEGIMFQIDRLMNAIESSPFGQLSTLFGGDDEEEDDGEEWKRDSEPE